MEVTKEVIRPGAYWYQDQAGHKRKLVVTKAAVDHLYKQGCDMLAAGLSIPVPLEHQDHAKPLTQQEKAAQQLRDNAGWVKSFVVHNGVLSSVTDITDTAVQKQINEGSVIHTSPKIDPGFMDGNGKNWESAITHLALTLRPRITKQAPFPTATPVGWDGAAAMSLENITEAVTPCSWASLTFRNKSWTLRDPVAFAFEEKKMADEKEEPKGEKEEKPPEKPVEKVAPVTPAVEADMTAVLEMLETKGIHLPPDTTMDNFISHLRVALHAVCGPDNAAAEEAEKLEQENAEKPGSEIVQEQPPLYMSLDYIQKKAAADPVMLSMVNRTFKDGKSKRDNRIAALCRRSPKAKELLPMLTEQAKTAELSITKDGTLVDPMESTLAALEKAIVDDRAVLLQRAGGDVTLGTEVPHPSDMGNGLTEEARQQLVRGLGQSIGVPAYTAK